MPSRQLPPDSGSPHSRSSGGNFPLIPVLCAGAAVAAFIATFFLVLFCRKRRSKSSSYPNLRRFSHREISHSTGGFSTENKLGQGGFGSVYHGVLGKGEPVAVKLMDPGSLQGEREFQNELVLAGKLAGCERVVSLLGFCSDNRKNRILIYEFMQNRSLQDVLFDRRCVRLLNWRVRFEIAVDVAKGIEFMHTRDPPIIHGDVKPSNVLLDLNFRAKIGDFGLAKLKSEIESPPTAAAAERIEPRKKKRKKKRRQQDEFSVDTEMESYSNSTPGPSPENSGNILFSPEAGELSLENCASEAAVEGCPSELLEKTSIVSEGGCLDKASVDSGSLRRGGGSCRKSVRDWWWRQDANSESGMKDYVMEWIGSEIGRERRLLSGNRGGGSVQSNEAGEGTPSKRKKASKLEWLAAHSSDEKRKKDRNPARKWWREEFCDELTRKSSAKRKKKRKEERWWEWEGSDSENVHRPKHWNLRGEFRLGRHNYCADISSTPSMRGTVCYVAPEYGGGGILSEKSDVYSYGVLLLVIVSGRRPLQVSEASPMAEFEKSNLISWSRQLALAGKLPELVDPNLQAVDFEQALLCITVAFLCLQRSPSRRPTISEVVKMLNGETELLHILPVEFSPSPPLCLSKTKNSVKRAPARTSGSQQQQQEAGESTAGTD